jgi:alpha-L-arabinofuranosidase
MKYFLHCALFAFCIAMIFAAAASAQDATITVHANQPGHRISRYLTGACIEDVNHEVYGGIYSQMIFGESFQEPAPTTPVKDFTAYGGNWNLDGEVLHFQGAPGDKLISQSPAFADGEVGVEVMLPNHECTNAGMIVRVSKPGVGVDDFDGYEVALNAAQPSVRLGRHKHNWELIQDSPCEVPVGKWISLSVKLNGTVLEIFVDGKSILRHDDGNAALRSGTVGLRAFYGEARYRNFWVKNATETKKLSFELVENPFEVSGMWRAVRRGDATGFCRIEKEHPFVGRQAQRFSLENGRGEIGVENQGLNRWGMYFEKDKPYEGILWARAEKPAEVSISLESKDGLQIAASHTLAIQEGDWQRLTFTLTPKEAIPAGRFTVSLNKPGSVVLGYAFLQPGDWGRFKGLPARRDVAESLIDQGITVLRYGGSMVNHPEYRWKKMIGPRDKRPPHANTWYPYASNGWGIIDFLSFCDAAGFLAIPDFNMDEKPEDMVDFIEYVNGPAESVWGRKRVEDGHPQPFQLRYLQLGNEECVNDIYFNKFKSLAEAIWAKDRDIILVVGDFFYSAPFADPFNIRGAGCTSLAPHQKILQLAKQHDREVWFDAHTETEGPRPNSSVAGFLCFRDALDKLADGARHQVVTFEFNANNHSQRRALANAIAIQTLQRDGRIPIATSANCLQPDKQNDNGWNQGLLFLNPSQVWLQPPGYVTRMISRNYQPVLAPVKVTDANDPLDVSATRSEDGKMLVLQVVNAGDRPKQTVIHLEGFAPARATAAVEELCGPLDAVNTADNPKRITPKTEVWRHGFTQNQVNRTFPPQSFTVIRFE